MSEFEDDEELARTAQAGNAAALGTLLDRHRADMYAVAVRMLNSISDAEDAVQEAALVALRHISDLRDPAAAGPWLRMVVRNICRSRLRRTSAVLVQDPMLEQADVTADPARLLDRHALKDWVWTALEELSPQQRLVTMLRYFTAAKSYADIASVCGTPVGTVRSRLNQARAKLAAALTVTSDETHRDNNAHTALHRQIASETMAAAHRGDLRSSMTGWWVPRTRVLWPSGRQTGLGYLENAFNKDLADGVRHEVLGVVASSDVVIWEARIHNPPEKPFHCPPHLVWVHSTEHGWANRIRLLHPSSSDGAADDISS